MGAMRKFGCFCLFLIVLMLSSCGASAQMVAPRAAVPGVSSAHGSSISPNIASSPRMQPAVPLEATPARLIIPTIGVNAPVENVGILANGDLATPIQNQWTGVGWFNGGTRPGEPGSSVIDGHLDRPGGYPAVFWNLRYVHVGDSVMVVDTDGKTLHFRVTRVAFYPPQAAPVQEIFGDSGGKYLNLITCAGDWIPSEHQTTLRLVVYTTRE